jgi:L-ascorbate metabolism protein UlaG (beta-lactamase superfamily)
MHFGTFPIINGTPAELEKALKQRGVKAKMTEMKVGETRTF